MCACVLHIRVVVDVSLNLRLPMEESQKVNDAETKKSQSSNISMFLRDMEVNHKRKSAEVLTVVVSEPWETVLCRFGEE